MTLIGILSVASVYFAARAEAQTQTLT